MLRIALLTISGVFMACKIVGVIVNKDTKNRAFGFINAFVYGLMFYYFWVN